MRLLATSTLQVLCALALMSAHVNTADAQAVPHGARQSLRRELADSLRRLLARAIADRAFPGAVAIVGDSRGIIANVSAGHVDWKPNAPRVTDQTIWDLASITKVMATTTAVAQLVERGLVALDSPAQRYLADWPGSGKERITVRQLLTHSSGLPAFRAYDRQTRNADSIAALIYGTELEFPVGERMVYSDIGAYALGRVIERVSGLRLDDYFARRIANPLGLRETMFRPPARLRSRIAPTEIDSLRGGLVHGAVHDERAYYLGGVAAHAGLFGSARDLARFAMMMLRGGAIDNTRILKPATIATFTTYADPSFSNRALGWQKPEREGMRFRTGSAWAGKSMSPSAYGHTGFTGTSIGIDPELDLFVVLLSNRVNPTRDNPRITAVRTSVTDAVVAAVKARRVGTGAISAP